MYIVSSLKLGRWNTGDVVLFVSMILSRIFCITNVLIRPTNYLLKYLRQSQSCNLYSFSFSFVGLKSPFYHNIIIYQIFPPTNQLESFPPLTLRPLTSPPDRNPFTHHASTIRLYPSHKGSHSTHFTTSHNHHYSNHHPRHHSN